ncbi:MAG: RsmG family class I SAM-dependent methyltransferase, partial [Litorimonas sp.]
MSGFGRDDFADESDVSHETLLAFDMWNRLLTRWNRSVNLVAQSTLSDFWGRHALDSWQVTRLMPKGAKTAIDLGSGAGFPGIALGIAFKDRNAGEV